MLVIVPRLICTLGYVGGPLPSYRLLINPCYRVRACMTNQALLPNNPARHPAVVQLHPVIYTPPIKQAARKNGNHRENILEETRAFLCPLI
jgi:hypothetical protein